jgi:hypothetical protein
VVTHAFGMTGWTPDASERVRLSARHEGQGDESRIFLFVIPADARGTWRAPGGWALRIGQNFQQVDISAWREGNPLEVHEARLRGSVLSFGGPGYAFRGSIAGGALAGELNGTKLIFTRAPSGGPMAHPTAPSRDSSVPADRAPP